MTAEEIRELVAVKFPTVFVEPLKDGYSFWFGRKQVSPYSTRIVRVNASGEKTMLKRAASSNRDRVDHDEHFTGDADSFLTLFNEELRLVELRVKSMTTFLPKFQVGQNYSRKDDITGRFGGSAQSGIAPSLKTPAIFLFTGDTGHKFGYRDSEEAGVFSYCGEGQVGNMQFVRGNAAVRDHAQSGRALHLFKVKAHGCDYLGEFCYSSHEIQRGADKDGNQRDIIVFHLVRVELVAENNSAGDENFNQALTLKDARIRALKACSPRQGASGTALRSIYERSEDVRRYVLLRANGKCESCGQQAPFITRRNTRYLEPHHTIRLSDGGLDHPQHVGAVCPNCHCEIHHGALGQAKNDELKRFVADREATLWGTNRFKSKSTSVSLSLEAGRSQVAI